MNKLMNILEYNKLYSFSLGPAAGPAEGGGPAGRSPAVRTRGWMGPHGIYGHLPDSLHAWGHPATFMECVQARFMRFWGDYVFSEGSA